MRESGPIWFMPVIKLPTSVNNVTNWFCTNRYKTLTSFRSSWVTVLKVWSNLLLSLGRKITTLYLPWLTSSTFFIHVSTLIFDENMTQFLHKSMAQKFWWETWFKIAWIVTVKNLPLRSPFPSKNSIFDPSCRRKNQKTFQILIHFSVEKSNHNQLLIHIIVGKLKFRLSMLLRCWTFFTHGLTLKFLKTYVDITSSMKRFLFYIAYWICVSPECVTRERIF